jgi:hypothetical protein
MSPARELRMVVSPEPMFGRYHGHRVTWANGWSPASRILSRYGTAWSLDPERALAAYWLAMLEKHAEEAAG